MNNLLVVKIPSFKAPSMVLLPVLTKSLFIAPVPEYAKDTWSPTSAHIFLNLFSNPSLKGKEIFSFEGVTLDNFKSFNINSKKYLPKTLWTTLVRSKESIQLVLKTTFCSWLYFNKSSLINISS